MTRKEWNATVEAATTYWNLWGWTNVRWEVLPDGRTKMFATKLGHEAVWCIHALRAVIRAHARDGVGFTKKAVCLRCL